MDAIAEDKHRDPWERQFNESGQAFAAFAVYRDQGSHRTLRATAASVGKSMTLMERWSSTWHWVTRAGAWDDEKDRIARMEQTNAVKRMNETQAGLGQAFQAQLVKRLQAMSPDDVMKMTVNEMAKMLEVSTRVERIARGAETDRVGHLLPEEIDDAFEFPDNERTTELVHDLIGQAVDSGSSEESGGFRRDGESKEVDTEAAPSLPERDDAEAGAEGDQAADRDGAASAREESAD